MGIGAEPARGNRCSGHPGRRSERRGNSQGGRAGIRHDTGVTQVSGEMMQVLTGRVVLGVAGFSMTVRDRAADLATIRAGIAAGAGILDTARAYAQVDDSLYGEQLAAEAAD